MRSLYQKKVKKRTIILAFFFMLWICLLILRLTQLQVINHSLLKAEVVEQNQNRYVIHPKRGTIYDRTGNILARSIPRKSVFFTPFKGEPHKLQLETILMLKKVLNLSSGDLQRIKARIAKNDPFIWVKRKIDSEKADKVKKLHLNGIHFMEENRRFYPQGKLAAHILGRVDIDDIGASGIEYKYNSVLEGKKGERLILRDAKRREYRFETIKKPIDGKDIILTIDETIQYIAEKELEKGVLKSKADWGTVIISHPSTGEILAMANYPTFNLNNIPPSLLLKLDRNKAIHHLFDPGSTFKIITASAALESKSVSFNDSFDCSEGAIIVAGKAIRDHDRFETLSFPEVIIHSSNVGTVKIGQRIGKEILFNMIKTFGFGKKTKIDLPAEENGIFRSLDEWTDISVASHSIGYEISVTPIQMLQAINIIANKGIIIHPKIVKKSPISSDEVKEILPQYPRVISEETASKLALILQGVVQEGTGKAAHIKGYSVVGKTGTAQKYDPSTGGYSSSAHIASFIGCVLGDEPVFSMIVVIDDPKGQYYGGQVAAPIFREIASKVLRYLHIPRQKNPVETLITAKYWRQTGE